MEAFGVRRAAKGVVTGVVQEIADMMPAEL